MPGRCGFCLAAKRAGPLPLHIRLLLTNAKSDRATAHAGRIFSSLTSAAVCSRIPTPLDTKSRPIGRENRPAASPYRFPTALAESGSACRAQRLRQGILCPCGGLPLRDNESRGGDGEEETRPHCRAGRSDSICWTSTLSLGVFRHPYIPRHVLYPNRTRVFKPSRPISVTLVLVMKWFV
jgi:hypothetical protein